MEKKLLRYISLLSLICFIFGMFDTYYLAQTFDKSMYYIISNVNFGFLLFFFLLTIISYYYQFKLVVLILCLEIIWSYFFDAVWIAKWVTTGMVQKIFYSRGEFLAIFSGIASLCCLLIFIFVLVILIMKIRGKYHRSINGGDR